MHEGFFHGLQLNKYLQNHSLVVKDHTHYIAKSGYSNRTFTLIENLDRCYEIVKCLIFEKFQSSNVIFLQNLSEIASE